MGDAIEVNSGQVVVELRVLEDPCAQWEAWRDEVRYQHTMALQQLALPDRQAQALTDQQITAAAERVELGDTLAASVCYHPRHGEYLGPISERIASYGQLTESASALRDALDTT